ncbi:ubiquinol-cytochrome-C oxidoreductase complex III subunit VIII [Drechmeria coniospora]|uniref:Cytochrome b-c1 complex subunit 8 n=1 Tax=Drechmeria coniospora TaxID=98403 RepID=A0A151GTV3_DRECN|nr:ubiquinol-cytochrome-C oxidoreductase complex III subunit VIII [Drechmeria coniospora]KYK60527.1 ubiquinol-cytochrome-C oxidoreductase complex III subunit VIII [Drechmeria coniospora]
MRPTQTMNGGGAPNWRVGQYVDSHGSRTSVASCRNYRHETAAASSLRFRNPLSDAKANLYRSFLGDWGSFGGSKQKGIVQYGVSANRQNPFAGAVHDAIFNTFRRTKSQIFYWLPPMLAGYYLMDWATERNHYLFSKAGRAEFGDDE